MKTKIIVLLLILCGVLCGGCTDNVLTKNYDFGYIHLEEKGMLVKGNIWVDSDMSDSEIEGILNDMKNKEFKDYECVTIFVFKNEY